MMIRTEIIRVMQRNPMIIVATAAASTTITIKFDKSHWKNLVKLSIENLTSIYWIAWFGLRVFGD